MSLLRFLILFFLLSSSASAQNPVVTDDGDLIELPRLHPSQQKALHEAAEKAGVVHQIGVNLRSLFRANDPAFAKASEEAIKAHFKNHPELVAKLEKQAEAILLRALQTFFARRTRKPGLLGTYISGIGLRHHTDLFLFPKETILAEERDDLPASHRAKAVLDTSLRQTEYGTLLKKINQKVERFRLLKTSPKSIPDPHRKTPFASRDLLFFDTAKKEEILWKPMIYWFDRYSVNLGDPTIRTWFVRKILQAVQTRVALAKKAGGKLDFLYLDNVGFSEDGLIRAPRPSRKVKGRIVQEIYYHPFPDEYHAFLRELRPALHVLGLRLVGNMGGLAFNIAKMPTPAFLDGLSLEQALDERYLLDPTFFLQEFQAYQRWLSEGKWLIFFPYVRSIEHRTFKQRALVSLGLFAQPSTPTQGVFSIHRTTLRGKFFDWPDQLGLPTGPVEIQATPCTLPSHTRHTRYVFQRSFQRGSLSFDFAQHACNLAKVGLSSHPTIQAALQCFCGKTADEDPWRLRLHTSARGLETP